MFFRINQSEERELSPATVETNMDTSLRKSIKQGALVLLILAVDMRLLAAQSYDAFCDNLGLYCYSDIVGQWWHTVPVDAPHWDESYGPVCDKDHDTCPVADVPPTDLGPPDDAGCGENNGTVGNPINTITGNKYQTEIDFSANTKWGIDFKRSYNSEVITHTLSGKIYPGTIGEHWRHNFQRGIHEFPSNAGDVRLVGVIRSSGRMEYFADQFNQNENEWIAVTVGKGRLVSRVDAMDQFIGWTYIEGNSRVAEVYDAQGLLTEMKIGDVNLYTLSYDTESRLTSVEDRFGKQLQFTYESAVAAARIQSVTMPDLSIYEYDYDAMGNLETVTFPDDTPLDPNDNPQRRYFYEDTSFPHALTGIEDERGIRYASWGYDSNGRANLSVHGTASSGEDRTSIDYTFLNDASDPRIRVTNSLNKVTVYHLSDEIQGLIRKVIEVEGEPTASCVAANQYYTYTVRGEVGTKTDWEGNVTRYEYDHTGLIAEVVRAEGEPEEQRTSTRWDVERRLKTIISDENKVIDFRYNCNTGELVDRIRYAIASVPDALAPSCPGPQIPH